MNSYPSSSQALEDLGDKVVGAIAQAFTETRADLASYRQTSPAIVTAHSERGLAGWIHDRYWSRLVGQLDGVSDVIVVDKEPLREVSVGYRYRMRLKRHHSDGAVSTYSTQTALEFLDQNSHPYLEGLEQVRLIAGYRWDRDSRDMVAPLISLRDGKDKVIWSIDLDIPASGETGGAVVRPQGPSPRKPTVSLPGAGRDQEKDVPE